MNKSFRLRLTGYCCLGFLILLVSASCQKKPSTPTNAVARQPQDHFLGTWKLDKEKTPVFSPYGYNPIPVYEWIVVRGDVRYGYTLTFSQSGKPEESERIFVTDMTTQGLGVDLVNGKMLAYGTYVRRIDADRFTQGSGFSENTYKVLPGLTTMTVKQVPFLDNGSERRLVYDKVPDTDTVDLPVPRF